MNRKACAIGGEPVVTRLAGRMEEFRQHFTASHLLLKQPRAPVFPETPDGPPFA